MLNEITLATILIYKLSSYKMGEGDKEGDWNITPALLTMIYHRQIYLQQQMKVHKILRERPINRSALQRIYMGS